MGDTRQWAYKRKIMCLPWWKLLSDLGKITLYDQENQAGPQGTGSNYESPYFLVKEKGVGGATEFR